MIRLLLILLFFITISVSAQLIDIKKTIIEGKFKLPNNIAAINYENELIYRLDASKYIPEKDENFLKHIRVNLKTEEKRIVKLFSSRSDQLKHSKYKISS